MFDIDIDDEYINAEKLAAVEIALMHYQRKLQTIQEIQKENPESQLELLCKIVGDEFIKRTSEILLNDDYWCEGK